MLTRGDSADLHKAHGPGPQPLLSNRMGLCQLIPGCSELQRTSQPTRVKGEEAEARVGGRGGKWRVDLEACPSPKSPFSTLGTHSPQRRGESTGSGTGTRGVSPSWVLWTVHLTSLCLSFPLYKMGMQNPVGSSSQGSCGIKKADT